MAAKWIQSISHEFTFTPDVTVDRLLYAIVCIRKKDKSDKSLEVIESDSGDNFLKYNLNYIVPDFMKLLFKMKNLPMCETINFANKDNASGDLITSMISRNGSQLEFMNLETFTRYCRDKEGGPIKALTKVTITLPFQIPDILHPPLKIWTLNKTKNVRELECKYLTEQITNGI